MVDEKRISRRDFLKLATCAAGVAAMVPQMSVLERLIPAAGAEAELGRGSLAILDSFGTLRVSQELLEDAAIDLPAVFLPINWADAEMLGRPEGKDTLFGYPIIWTQQVEG